MTDFELKEKCLWIAIGHHLSDYNKELTTAQMVIDAIENDLTELYVPWFPFEDEEGCVLVDYIISMATDIYDLAIQANKEGVMSCQN